MSRLVNLSHAHMMLVLICSFASLANAMEPKLLEISHRPYPPAPIASGTLSLAFDEVKLWKMGIEITPVGGFDVANHENMLEFSFDVIGPGNLEASPNTAQALLTSASGAIVLERDGIREIVSAIGLTYGNDGAVWLHSAVRNQVDGATFVLSDATWYNNRFGEQLLYGDISLTPSAASRLGIQDLSEIVVGHLLLSPELRDLEVETADLGIDSITQTYDPNGQLANQSLAPSPDVIVGDLHQLNSYGVDGNKSAFSVGTVSCNIGTAPLNWFFNINQHPVIGQNMYRYRGGQFEQIGMSWLKHGFFALSENLCSGGQCNGDPSGEHLGPGCSDPYSAGLNGQQGNLGPRSEVNALTGAYPFPYGGAPVDSLLSRRLQVDNDNLSLAMNVGAQYFVEGQYVTPDDATGKNGSNNASYRKIVVAPSGGGYNISFSGEDTVRRLPAIHAWKAIDPQVQITSLLVPSEGYFTLGARVTDLGNGTWHYEYALHNLNSHQSGQSFSVPIFPGIILTNIGFHDVAYHSGEPYAQIPWQVQVTDDAITWSTDDFSVDPNANALRWGTMYNFRFDANVPSDQKISTIGLFRPGAVGSVTAMAPAPTDQLIAAGVVMPSHADSKDRYISINPSTNGGQSIAIRVTRANSTDTAYVSCVSQDLGSQGVYSTLVAAPEFCAWSTQVLHIGGCIIAPGNTYSVENTLDDVDFSAPLLVSTTDVPSPREFGDVVGAFVDDAWTGPDGLVNAIDVVASVQGFLLTPTAASIARLDVVPSIPNRILAANDILAIVLAFSGDAYEFGQMCSTGTCEPDCTNP